MARVNLTTDVLGDVEPPPAAPAAAAEVPGDDVEPSQAASPAAPRPRRASREEAPIPSRSVDPRPRKFTMLVGVEDDERARRVTDDVVELAGIRPTKSMRADVLRALVTLADADPRLRQRAAKLLRRDGMPS